MVVGRSFMRSLSFPNKKPPPPPPPFSHHFRSISLPSRPHPLISHLRLQITHLRLLSSSSTSAVLLSQLKDLHDYLHDILHLPQTQHSLSQIPTFTNRLLDHFLRFADAFGTFLALLSLSKEHLFAAKLALRKRDESQIATFLKSRNKLAKEMGRLVRTVRGPTTVRGRRGDEYNGAVCSYEAAELAAILGEVVEVTVLVSEAVFGGFCTVRKTAASSLSRWMVIRGLMKGTRRSTVEGNDEEIVMERVLWGGSLKRKSEEEIRDVVKRMQRMEGCVCEIEEGGERVFRSLITTRVSLLNSLTLR